MFVDLVARTTIWLAVLGLWAFLSIPHDGKLLPTWRGAPTLFGGVLFLAGFSLYLAGAVSLALTKRNSLGAPEALLTRGPYGYVRNPVYLGMGVIIVGLLLLYQAWHFAGVAKTALLFTAAHLAVVFLEEPGIRRRFGASYDDYCRRVPRWLPRRRRFRSPPGQHLG
jgi:protein-S-isoprenylcysteine O-methyltransferase Ste14